MITSKDNQFIKLIRSIRNGKEIGFWMIEGIRSAIECLLAKLQPIAILIDPQRYTDEEFVILQNLAPGIVFETSRQLLEAVADQDSSVGLVAIFVRRVQSIVTLTKDPGLYLFAERIQDPRNLGALVRTSMAFGVKAIFIGPGSCSATHPRAIRASSGIIARAPILEDISAYTAIKSLERLSPLVASLDAKGSCPIDRQMFPATLLLLVGTEGAGLSRELKERSAVAISIPMLSEVESLNLATAAAVACYEFARQTRQEKSRAD